MTEADGVRAATRPTLACLHGHHANIGALDGLFPADVVDVVHYVDPGLLRRTMAGPDVPYRARAARVASQLAWIAACGCDAIAVTCTAYAALAGVVAGPGGTPVVTIDAPFFADLAACDGPVMLAFTNPGTVGPTMHRLAEALGDARPAIRPILIPDAFQLVLDGRADAYRDLVASHLRVMADAHDRAVVAVAQLSMVGAAHRVRDESGVGIRTPLEPLARRLADVLGIALSGERRA